VGELTGYVMSTDELAVMYFALPRSICARV
jgi:hypothetical protein